MRLAFPWYRSSADTWYTTLDGRKVSLGVKGIKNKSQALKAWKALAAKPKPKRSSVNVGDVIAAFLHDAERRVATITLNRYRQHLLPFKEKYGSVNVERLTPSLAENYVRSKPWNSTTQHGTLSAIVTAFRWALNKARLIETFPLNGLTIPPKLSASNVAFNADAFAQLLNDCRRTPELQAVFRFLWATGCRPSEAFGLTFDAIEGDLIRLKTHKTAHKGQSRTIYLNVEAKAVIDAQRERWASGLVFRNAQGLAFERMAIVRRLWRFRQRTGIKITAYGFRHSFATRALSSGVPDAHVAALLGHSSTTMLHRHYSHLTQRSDVLRQALASFA